MNQPTDKLNRNDAHGDLWTNEVIEACRAAGWELPERSKGIPGYYPSEPMRAFKDGYLAGKVAAASAASLTNSPGAAFDHGPAAARGTNAAPQRIVEEVGAPPPAAVAAPRSSARPSKALAEKVAHILALEKKALPGPWSHKVLRDYLLSPHDNDTPYVYGPNDTKVLCGLWPIHGPKPEDVIEAERQTFATIELVAALRNLIHEHGDELAQSASSATSPSNWVPSIERTPRDHEHVLGWIVGGSLHHDEDYMDIVMYLNGLFRMCNGTEDEPVPVTHWMPMPESPSRAEGAAK